MKKWVFAIFLLTGALQATSQEAVIKRTQLAIDSILGLMEKEKDPDKRLEKVLAIYTTSSEGFPALMFEAYQKMYLLSQKTGDIIAESSSWSFAGQGYRLTGNYTKALECHHKAVALAEKSGNPLLLGYAQNQQAHIYKDREETDKAISLYKAAADNIGKADNVFLSMWPMMNLGAVLLATNQLDSSLYYSERAYDYIAKFNLGGYADYVLSNIAGVYSKKGDIQKANDYFRQAIKQAEKSLSPRFMNTTYVAIAEHFYRHRQLDSCAYYAKKAVSVVQNTVLSNLVLKPARMLTNIYQSTNADSTLKYLQVYTVANDSLFNTRANQQLQMLTFEEDQRQRDMVAEKITYQNKIKTNILIAGLAVFSLVAFILYRNNRQKQKTNKVLAKTLEDLKATQSQLIQSEKMASLGELTAGIAHEIQNPLNFVNNFSEINKELLAELKEEIKNGNLEDVNTIADDLISNEEKITHHGKRADAIVKGMLQHSRSSSAQKEPTDINGLCDEYLRLSYHGLRAKDKNFNAGLKTDFDGTIGQIKIIPQDIGRVLLNLFTNAFYTVNEKTLSLRKESPSQTAVYQPAVKVSTHKANNKVEIRVEDNGNGIPEEIKDKIFQPFFTTKPTGQGTGLGLSLSYDIVKAHNGELKVETKPGEGTVFVVILPV